jgi:hypothetical protein
MVCGIPSTAKHSFKTMGTPKKTGSGSRPFAFRRHAARRLSASSASASAASKRSADREFSTG